ncbi:MAG TPA: SRPBCC family protein [Frankiaceae bacterium]|jgi:hypothetical protein|nr:SRPBCC family protein [Frankiaceae bacterium]
MDTQTSTRSIESTAPPGAVLDILADARRLPEWAPGFADTIEGDQKHGWRVTKDSDAFEIRVVVQQEARTVDYLRQVAPGLVGGAYLRVTPLMGGGSSVVITVPVIGDPDVVAATLDAELAAITRLAQAAIPA